MSFVRLITHRSRSRVALRHEPRQTNERLRSCNLYTFVATIFREFPSFSEPNLSLIPVFWQMKSKPKTHYPSIRLFMYAVRQHYRPRRLPGAISHYKALIVSYNSRAVVFRMFTIKRTHTVDIIIIAEKLKERKKKQF